MLDPTTRNHLTREGRGAGATPPPPTKLDLAGVRWADGRTQKRGGCRGWVGGQRQKNCLRKEVQTKGETRFN